MSPQQIEELAGILQGTCRSIESGVTQMGLEDDEYDTAEIEDALADHIELCQGCEWWHEPSELAPVDDDGPVGYCDDCRPDYT